MLQQQSAGSLFPPETQAVDPHLDPFHASPSCSSSAFHPSRALAVSMCLVMNCTCTSFIYPKWRYANSISGVYTSDASLSQVLLSAPALLAASLNTVGLSRCWYGRGTPFTPVEGTHRWMSGYDSYCGLVENLTVAAVSPSLRPRHLIKRRKYSDEDATTM